MASMKDVGILLIIAGGSILLAGIAVLLAARLPWLGHLPGDIHLQGKHGAFTFPLTTCILLSIVLTILLNVVVRLFHR